MTAPPTIAHPRLSPNGYRKLTFAVPAALDERLRAIAVARGDRYTQPAIVDTLTRDLTTYADAAPAVDFARTNDRAVSISLRDEDFQRLWRLVHATRRTYTDVILAAIARQLGSDPDTETERSS